MFKILKDPQEAEYMMTNCGHELYEGEHFYEFDGKTWCEDCFREELFCLPISDLALLVQAFETEVKF